MKIPHYCEICGTELKEIKCAVCDGKGVQRVRRFLKYIQKECTSCNGYKTTYICPRYSQHVDEGARIAKVYICPACKGTGVVWKAGSYEPCDCVGGYWGAFLPKKLRGDSSVVYIEPPPPQRRYCGICGGKLMDVECPVCSGSGKIQSSNLTCYKCNGQGRAKKCVNEDKRNHKDNRNYIIVRSNDFGAYHKVKKTAWPILL